MPPHDPPPADPELESLLRALADGRSPSSSALERLAADVAADPVRARAFGLDPAEATAIALRRAELMARVGPKLRLDPTLKTLSDRPTTPATLWQFWLPLALNAADARRNLGRPLVLGILGGQGVGKTTLGRVLTLALETLGDRCLSLSLDDIYKTYRDRQALRERDPRLIWRGPPGTHDVDLAIAAIDALKAERGQPVSIPRFDKSLHGGQGDRADSETVTGADVILFEGWFAGAQPVDPAAFDGAPPPIVSEGDRAFARDCNERLRDYLPLWARFDRLLVLYPTDYRLSKQWRKEAERERIAAGGAGMDDAEIEAFVDYFWKALHPDLFVAPLLNAGADLVVTVDGDRRLGRIYAPTRDAPAAKTSGREGPG